MHFSILKTAVKIDQKMKKHKNCQYFGNELKYCKILKIST